MDRKTRKERIAARSKQARRRRIGSIAVILGGLTLLVGAGLMLRTGARAGGASFEYSQTDISYDRPLLAVHEMGAGPPISFLPKDGPQPKIAVEEDYFNFGKLGSTEVVIRDFAIANFGDAPLTISRAYTTCGCTTADFTSSVIPPGQVSIMTLRFDAGYHDTAGQTVRRGVIIESNDPDHPSVEIWVQASVLSTP